MIPPRCTGTSNPTYATAKPCCSWCGKSPPQNNTNTSCWCPEDYGYKGQYTCLSPVGASVTGSIGGSDHRTFAYWFSGNNCTTSTTVLVAPVGGDPDLNVTSLVTGKVFSGSLYSVDGTFLCCGDGFDGPVMITVWSARDTSSSYLLVVTPTPRLLPVTSYFWAGKGDS